MFAQHLYHLYHSHRLPGPSTVSGTTNRNHRDGKRRRRDPVLTLKIKYQELRGAKILSIVIFTQEKCYLPQYNNLITS